MQALNPKKRTYKVQSPLSVGLLGGKWCSYSTAPDLPHDQHEDDGGSLIFEREGWKVETMTRTILTSGKHRFKVRATLDAYLNGSRVFSNSWDESIPRKLL